MYNFSTHYPLSVFPLCLHCTPRSTTFFSAQLLYKVTVLLESINQFSWNWLEYAWRDTLSYLVFIIPAYLTQAWPSQMDHLYTKTMYAYCFITDHILMWSTFHLLVTQITRLNNLLCFVFICVWTCTVSNWSEVWSTSFTRLWIYQSVIWRNVGHGIPHLYDIQTTHNSHILHHNWEVAHKPKTSKIIYESLNINFTKFS